MNAIDMNLILNFGILNLFRLLSDILEAQQNPCLIQKPFPVIFR